MAHDARKLSAWTHARRVAAWPRGSVGNVGNRKQIAHIAHKHAGVGICGQCGQ